MPIIALIEEKFPVSKFRDNFHTDETAEFGQV